MAIHSDHRWVMEFTRTNGEQAGSSPFNPDWEPAMQYLRFEAIRHERLGCAAALWDLRIVPGWHDRKGRPQVSTVKVVADTPAAGLCADLGPDYFKSAAEEKSSELVKRGVFTAGEAFRFTVSAYPVDGVESVAALPQAGIALEVEEEPVSLVVLERPMKSFLAGHRGDGGENNGRELPIFVEPSIIEEARGRAAEAGDVETGGVLVGRLFRDPASRAVFAEVSALIPAVHAEASSTRLTFTADTWAAVEAARKLRGRDEIIIGWIHSHPDWCRNCPSERADGCPLSRDFFSRDDVRMHRTCFPGAHQVALLLSDHSENMTTTCYGWQCGVVAHRDFDLMQPGRSTSGGWIPRRVPAPVAPRERDVGKEIQQCRE